EQTAEAVAPAAVDAQEDERVQVMPRRKPRQLTQKVRVGDNNDQPQAAAVESAESADVQKVQPVVETSQVEETEENEGRDNANMPRRSRRSPRHLRVSGQRRRR
ncbi:hypothetical protein, partial [Pantoea ananatis]